MPFLSIVIPVYNRATFIDRCLASVIQQTYTDWEIIAVDDASTDYSVEVLRSYSSSKISLIEHQKNLGAMAARRTGWKAAKGQWIIGLDSDDELIPETLITIYERLKQTPTDIIFALFHCIMDDGGISPYPALNSGIMDYKDFLQSMEGHFKQNFDIIHCMRTGFDNNLANAPITEELFFLTIHKCWKSIVYPEIVLMYHQDTHNHASKAALPRDENSICLQTAILEQLVDLHGDALRQYAPRWFHYYTSRLASLEYTLGYRRYGLKYNIMAIGSNPINLKSWIPLIGLFNKNILNWSRTIKAFLIK